MIDVLKFLLEYTVKFISMLFTIDVGNGINLGTMMCIVFIFFPIVLLVVNSLKLMIVDELDERYDSRRDKKIKSEGVPFYFKKDEKNFEMGKKKYVLKRYNRFGKE